MPENNQNLDYSPKIFPGWLNSRATRIDRIYFRIAFYEYLAAENMDMDNLPRLCTMLRGMIPYLSRHRKQWSQLQPHEYNFTTMRQVHNLYDIIKEEASDLAGLK